MGTPPPPLRPDIVGMRRSTFIRLRCMHDIEYISPIEYTPPSLPSSPPRAMGQRRGAFGAPWITVRIGDDDGKPWEAFFGCDRFDVLAEAIGQPWLGPRPWPSRL